MPNKDRPVSHTNETSKLERIVTFDPRAVCGFDEVGRGPLAGPVVAGAAILDPARSIAGLADSKALSASRRTELAVAIRENALAWGLGWVWPEEIEKLNIHFASLEAMRRASLDLQRRNAPAWDGVGLAVSDGKFCPELDAPRIERMSLIKGDALCAAISAASIIAKVARDEWMIAYAAQDSRYGFERHMGYPTAAHWAAIHRHGPCVIHRQSWVAKRPAPKNLELPL